MRGICGAVLALCLSGAVLLDAVDSPIFDAIRRGDAAAVRTYLASGGDPNSADDTGATLLMLTTVHGTEQDMRALIDRRADINAANAYGSTALMWATGDPGKTKLLLDRGASPHARAVDRTTALLTATRRGNIDAMRLLLGRGADPKANASDTANLLRAAYSPDNQARPQVRQLLAQHGVTLSDPAHIGTPLIAQNLARPPLVRELLAAGVDPKQDVPIVTLTLPTLALAASSGVVDSVRMLLASGADPNAAGTHGWTPLMFAAGAIQPDPAVVRLLMDAGARLDARDDVGRTAFDWALLQGETPVVRQLREAGAVAMAPPPAAPAPIAVPRAPEAAIARAIAQLQPASPVFTQQTKCISCHHQSLPAMAVRLASAHGVTVDRALASHPAQATLAVWKGTREQHLLGNPAFGGFVANTAYGLVALDDEGVPPNPVTDAVALLLASLQLENGSWSIPVGNSGGGIRPPLGGGDDIHLTAFVVRGLAAYAPPGARPEVTARIARARDFLRAAVPIDTQGAALKLLGLAWTQAPAADLAAQARRVLALQRPDGGWAQLPTLASDAYATGQTLYALHAGGVAATAPEYRKGAAYLLRTQLDDGTWFVRSRGFGFQPYFETGFPHGRNQFISAAATSWAALALAHTLP